MPKSLLTMLLTVSLLTVPAGAWGQHLVVTAEGHHGSQTPELTQDDVSIEVNKHPARIETFLPLRGDQAALEFYIVIDDGEDTDLGLQYDSLKSFINSQPPATRIGLAYLRNGSANIAAPLTTDHAAVDKAFRLPLGQAGISASPYMGISDLIRKWPATAARREILLIASGIDPWSPPDPENPYLQKAIADAQRGGVLVHSIYYWEAGHLGHSYRRVNWGQGLLVRTGRRYRRRGLLARYRQPGFLRPLPEGSDHAAAKSIPAHPRRGGQERRSRISQSCRLQSRSVAGRGVQNTLEKVDGRAVPALIHHRTYLRLIPDNNQSQII